MDETSLRIGGTLARWLLRPFGEVLIVEILVFARCFAAYILRSEYANESCNIPSLLNRDFVL